MNNKSRHNFLKNEKDHYSIENTSKLFKERQEINIQLMYMRCDELGLPRTEYKNFHSVSFWRIMYRIQIDKKGLSLKSFESGPGKPRLMSRMYFHLTETRSMDKNEMKKADRYYIHKIFNE